MFQPPLYFEPRRNTGCLRLSKLIVENEGSKGKVAVDDRGLIKFC